MGNREVRQMPSAVRKLCGHSEEGPSRVVRQSMERVSAPVSPPPAMKDSIRRRHTCKCRRETTGACASASSLHDACRGAPAGAPMSTLGAFPGRLHDWVELPVVDHFEIFPKS